MIKNKKINNDDISVIILAGGFGSRIKHLYPNKPKPLIKIENKPFSILACQEKLTVLI